MPAHSVNADDYQHVACPVACMEKQFADGARTAMHSHARGQLVYATRGAMRIVADDRHWVLPPGRAMFIPPATRHALQMVGPVSMLTLYIRADAAGALGGQCRIIAVSALLRELLAGARVPADVQENDSRADLIARLILVELAQGASDPLSFAMPRDARLLRICEALLKTPGATHSLDDWAAEVGASARTLARRFRSETGLGFLAWRQQVRLADALCQLGQGRTVKQVALNLGYRSPSAFVAMFHAALGQTPAAYAAGAVTINLAPSVAMTPPAARSTHCL